MNLPHFTPAKLTSNRLRKPMGQPANFGMFYGLSDSRTWAGNAELPTPKNRWPKRARKRDIEEFLFSRITPH
ncbi:hypothetical protein EI614_05655 [Vibrio parahaemolyticus]|nr:hypothetical protein [Vibrio parahaemolyticus]EGR0955850.1 hypothetical protein [Vibrio parahaemolyticus]EGR1692140.1 hypothetical protein [Vibrio parahaemolyticus]EGR2656079.1 hypothetical protein [Vibrio parahaemolyticus]EGR2787081.1 hypothetical protein [Vibrio parahaemolyticus]